MKQTCLKEIVGEKDKEGGDKAVCGLEKHSRKGEGVPRFHLIGPQLYEMETTMKKLKNHDRLYNKSLRKLCMAIDMTLNSFVLTLMIMTVRGALNSYKPVYEITNPLQQQLLQDSTDRHLLS